MSVGAQLPARPWPACSGGWAHPRPGAQATPVPAVVARSPAQGARRRKQGALGGAAVVASESARKEVGEGEDSARMLTVPSI